MGRVGSRTGSTPRAIFFIALAAATLAALAPVIGAGYVDYDDDIYVSVNPHVQGGLGPAGLRWALTSFYASNWHPVTWLSHMLDWQAYGMAPSGHHVSSLLIHLGAVLVLFVAFDELTGAPGRSAFMAALFAVHPLHVESVAWLAERKDVLCALFWFAAIAAYARRRKTARFGLGAMVVVFAVLALMSKPMAVTLPLTLLLIDVWPLERGLRENAYTAAREKIPLFALAAAASVLTVMAQYRGHSMVAIPVLERAANAAVAAVWYLVKTIWPSGLAVFYPHPGVSLPAWKIAGSIAVLAAITAAAVRLRRERPYLLFGWLWYLVTLVPVIGLIQVGQQGMADRYTYVPLVGIFAAVSFGLYDAIPRAARVIPALAVVAALIVLTRAQAATWKDGEALFTRALAVTENNDVAHAHLGLLRARQGRFAEADQHFREALRIHPASAGAHLDLGSNLAQMGKGDEALAEFRAALALDPGDPRIHTNLGGLFEREGNLVEARAHFLEAIRLDPDFEAAHLGLGVVSAASGRLDDALVQFREGIRLDPGSAEPHDRAATVLARLGRFDEAYAEFAASIRLDPKRADTHCNWGTALASQSRYREAAAHFAEAIRIEPQLARAHFSLAAASYYLEDYGVAWREVKLARAAGLEPPPAFVSSLAAKMPEPQ